MHVIVRTGKPNEAGDGEIVATVQTAEMAQGVLDALPASADPHIQYEPDGNEGFEVAQSKGVQLPEVAQFWKGKVAERMGEVRPEVGRSFGLREFMTYD